MSPREGARLIGIGRATLGLAILAAPERVTRAWLGEHNARQPLVRGLARMLAVRDLALGLATLQTLDDPVIGPRVVAAAAVADGIDTLATGMARRALPRSGMLGTVAVAGATAVAGFYFSHRLARD